MSCWAELQRENKYDWSVESDEKLFTQLESFAERIIDRSSKVSSELEELVKATNATACELNCVFNSLSNLASSQYVANLIQEKDTQVPSGNSSQSEVPRNEQLQRLQTLSDARREKIQSQEIREQNLLPKQQQALSLAIKGLKVEDLIKEGDADDMVSNMTLGSQVFRGCIKKLPHLFGTTNFFNDPWIGLYDEEQNLDNVEIPTEDQQFRNSIYNQKSFETPKDNGTSSAPTPPPLPNNAPTPPPLPSNAPTPPPLPSNAPKPSPLASQSVASFSPPKSAAQFQQNLQTTLERRKRIIDGEEKGELSVQETLNYESKVLGVPERVVNTYAPGPGTKKPEEKKAPDQMSNSEKKAMLEGLFGSRAPAAKPVEKPPEKPVEEDQEEDNPIFSKPRPSTKQYPSLFSEVTEQENAPRLSQKSSLFEFMEEEEEDVAEKLMSENPFLFKDKKEPQKPEAPKNPFTEQPKPEEPKPDTEITMNRPTRRRTINKTSKEFEFDEQKPQEKPQEPQEPKGRTSLFDEPKSKTSLFDESKANRPSKMSLFDDEEEEPKISKKKTLKPSLFDDD